MVEEFADAASPTFTQTVVRTYALSLAHKHVPEMKLHGGLAHPPLFAPAVGRFYRGMMVEVPLQLWALPGRPRAAAIHDAIARAYADEVLIEVAPPGETASTLDPELLKGVDRMRLFVFGNDRTQQARLVAVLDNLGKGASGAAGPESQSHAGSSRTGGPALMYRPAAYAIDDVAVLHETMRRRSFATLAGLVRGRVQFAYAPVVVDADPAPWAPASTSTPTCSCTELEPCTAPVAGQRPAGSRCTNGSAEYAAWYVAWAVSSSTPGLSAAVQLARIPRGIGASTGVNDTATA